MCSPFSSILIHLSHIFTWNHNNVSAQWPGAGGQGHSGSRVDETRPKNGEDQDGAQGNSNNTVTGHTGGCGEPWEPCWKSFRESCLRRWQRCISLRIRDWPECQLDKEQEVPEDGRHGRHKEQQQLKGDILFLIYCWISSLIYLSLTVTVSTKE